MGTGNKSRKAVAAALIVALSIPFVTPAWAGLQDALDGMFISNATAPQAYSSQTRGGFVGGGLTLRAPVRNINLVALDPPRFSAGCGGIDMYGGSFSFVNAAQLTALFRQIAANAVAAAFQAAIKVIDPLIGGIMSEFQAKIQSLNQMLKNTCSVRLKDVAALFSSDAKSNDAQEKGAAENTAKGASTDLFDSFTKFFTDFGGSLSTSKTSCDTCGNQTWKALTDSGAGAYLGNPATVEPSVTMANYIIMSLLGSVIVDTVPDNSNPGGLPKPGKTTAVPSTLTLLNLRDGGKDGNKLSILTCDADASREGCLSPSIQATPFVGTLGYTRAMLVGAETASDPYANGNGSVVDKIAFCTGAECAMTNAQKAFINTITAPVIKMLRDVQTDPNTMYVVAELLIPIIADELAAKYGEAALKASRMAYSTPGITKDASIVAREADLHKEFLQLRQRSDEKLNALLTAQKYIDQFAKTKTETIANRSRK